MGRKIHIRLSGLAENFMQEMIKEGLTEEDVIAQALGMMAEVWNTQAVARIKPEYRYVQIEAIDFYYNIQTPNGTQAPNQSLERERIKEKAEDFSKSVEEEFTNLKEKLRRRNEEEQGGARDYE